MHTEDKNNNENFGRRLAQLRKEKGFTQIELAEELGIAQSTLADYERNKLRLHDLLLVKIAKALRISIDELLGIEKKSQKKTEISLRFSKRLKEIEKLPEIRKKAILRTLDDLILASQKKE
jgi:transcriptional regulator with XRE-family HTH domain